MTEIENETLQCVVAALSEAEKALGSAALEKADKGLCFVPSGGAPADGMKDPTYSFLRGAQYRVDKALSALLDEMRRRDV